MGFPAGEQTWGRRWGQGGHKTHCQRRRRDNGCRHAEISAQSPRGHIQAHFLSDLLSLPLDTMFGLHVTECYLSNPSREFYFLKISSEPHLQSACFSLAGINRSVFTVRARLDRIPLSSREAGQAVSRLEHGFQGSAGTWQNGVIKIIFKKQAA